MVDMENGNKEELAVATLAGGCFWCLDAVYRGLKGVKDVVSGYAGGQVPNPSYQAVCTGATGHAEVVQVHYDPDEITYRDLLQVFFTIHDPTTLNQQGPDVGTQYRSAIYTHDADQARIADEVIRQVADEGWWDDEIVTEVEPLDQFYAAEEYHQNYFARNPNQGYCRAIIAPKVIKFRKRWQERLKGDPVGG